MARLYRDIPRNLCFPRAQSRIKKFQISKPREEESENGKEENEQGGNQNFL